MKKTRKILALGLSFVMMLGLCLTAGTVNATGDITAVEVSTADEFVKKYKDENVRNFKVTAPLHFNDYVDFKDITVTADEGVNDNLLTFTKGGTLTNVDVTTAADTKYAIHIYECGMTINNLTVNHSLNKGGAPVLVNGNSSSATFTGNLNMTLGSTSWYGVNVDTGSADFTNASIDCKTDDANKTQSIICTDNAGKVNLNNSSTFSTVKTTAEGDEGNQTQVAYVKGEDLADFITEKQITSKNVDEVVVKERITLNESLFLNEDMTITCDGNGAFVAGENLNDNVVTVTQGVTVTLNNVKIETKVNAAKSGLHIYGGTVTAENLTIINENTDKDGKGGGAAIVLNSGKLTLRGKTTFELGKDSWGGINLDNRLGPNPVLNIDNGAIIDVTSPEDSVGLYYVDADKQNIIPISGVNSVVKLPKDYTITINDKTGTIDANGELKHSHQATRVPAKEATYDATGNIEYWYCAECDKYFADAALTKEISKTDTVIPKLEKPGQPVDPEKEMITITLKAIVDGKEIDLEELGLKPEQYILPVEKGIAFTADDLKVLDEMKESLSVDGYTFRGYFLDAKGTEALKADVPFNADATIYMIWDKEVDVTVTPNPGDTEKPNTEKPNTDNTNKPEQKPTETDKTVKTDDSSNAALYGLMISLSVVGAGIVVLAKKREKLLNK